MKILLALAALLPLLAAGPVSGAPSGLPAATTVSTAAATFAAHEVQAAAAKKKRKRTAPAGERTRKPKKAAPRA